MSKQLRRIAGLLVLLVALIVVSCTAAPRQEPPTARNEAAPQATSAPTPPRVARHALPVDTYTGPAETHTGPAQVKLIWPLKRTAYQDNEWIDVSALRSSPQALTAGDLALTLSGADGSKFLFTFPVEAVVVAGTTAATTEHLHLNGRYLRPGHYTVEVSADGATARNEIDVFSHVRKSEFRLIDWGRAQGAQAQLIGEDSLGFNMFYGSPSAGDDGSLVRGGADFMPVCTMGGGHQMDLRMDCDWSDPYVSRGGTGRVVRAALSNRTWPNFLGVHFYDEPGLTWWIDPQAPDPKNSLTPHMIPAQVRSYVSEFDHEPLRYNKVDPKKPADVDQWIQWATWKLSLMDGAWKEAQFGVKDVNNNFLTATQSQYGWSAFADGYYFNVARSLSVTSGHGGYHDFGLKNFNPSYFLEMARARDYWKTDWYLPAWYGNTTPDQFRMEQYASFVSGLQGLMSPPDIDPVNNAFTRQGVVESNFLMQRLGPIFDAMPTTKPAVAILYSMSDLLHAQARDMNANYSQGMHQGQSIMFAYLATKMIQQPMMAVVDEDVLDGSIAEHKAILVCGVDDPDPRVVAALVDYIAQGGIVIAVDCGARIKGAVVLDIKPRMPEQDAIDKAMAEKKYGELTPYQTMSKYFQATTPLAKALKAELDKAGIKPAFESTANTIAAGRQADGDIEYLFAINATPDEHPLDPKTDAGIGLAPTETKIGLSGGKDTRPIYDAILGGQAGEFKNIGDSFEAQFRFGPGQMRAWARTARPIGGVKLATPTVHRMFVVDTDPITLSLAASVVDNKGGLLNAAIPLEIKVVDSLGATRYHLFRSTRQGELAEKLPLAANDPAGEWKVSVREMLSGAEDSASFNYTPPGRAAAIAGATHRAVFFGNDLDNCFRFAREHRAATIVKGSGDYDNAAAERLVKILEPWGVTCTIITAANANKPRSLSDEEASTWVGFQYTPKGTVKPGTGNSPLYAGFAVNGPAILLGTPDDNPLIKFLADNGFLSYTPVAGSFPGVGRGMVAWQRDGIGKGQDSITLIGYDAAGMSEAVGTLYGAVAGLDPLTRYRWPSSNSVSAAKSDPGVQSELSSAWTAVLPDRVLTLGVTDGAITALTEDGSLTKMSAKGKIGSAQVLGAADIAKAVNTAATANTAAIAEVSKTQARPDRMVKLAATAPGTGHTAVAYWGGTLRLIDGKGIVVAQQQLSQDITALTWLDGHLIVGLANGEVVALNMK